MTDEVMRQELEAAEKDGVEIVKEFISPNVAVPSSSDMALDGIVPPELPAFGKEEKQTTGRAAQVSAAPFQSRSKGEGKGASRSVSPRGVSPRTDTVGDAVVSTPPGAQVLG